MLDPNEILKQNFHHHGHPQATHNGDWVVIPDNPPARASVYIHDSGRPFVNLQLDVEIALDDGRIIVESVAGLGKDHDEALTNGFSKFAANSFHALLCAFYDYPVNEQIDVHTWDIHGEKWDVFMGPFSVIHYGNNGSMDQPESVTHTPGDLFTFIESQLKSRSMESDVHWARFYYAQQDGNYKASEVLWDNEIWQESEEKLRGLDWPGLEGYFSVRSFIILRKKGAAKHGGGSETAMHIEQALSMLLNYCGQHPNTDDMTIYQQLLNAQVSPSLADRIIIFGPMCFSAIILRDAFPTEYLIHAEAEPIAKKLAEEPIFAVGRRYAMAVGGIPEKRDAFMSVASRCALFKAANQALKQGSKLDDLVFSPPVVFVDRFR